MQRYVARRLVLGALTAILVSVLVFAILRIAPGDVAMMLALQMSGGGEVEISEATLERIRAQMGLNARLHIQYFTWIGNWLTLDWGTSMYTGVGVWEEFKRKIPVTLELVLIAQMLALIGGIPAGIAMALKRDTWVDYVIRVISLGGLSIPSFWTATLLLVGGLYLFDWNPQLRYVSLFDNPIGNLSMFFWPALILGYVSMATKARMMRSTMLEVLRQDYIRTAHAKGLNSFVVTYRHAMKNAFIPVITVIGVTFAMTMGGSVIIERIFNIAGIGHYLVQGMNMRDYTVVQSMIMVFALWVVLINLLVDLTYGWLDPRVRYE